MKRAKLLVLLLAATKAYAVGDFAEVEPGKEVSVSAPSAQKSPSASKKDKKTKGAAVSVAPGVAMPAEGKKIVVTSAVVPDVVASEQLPGTGGSSKEGNSRPAGSDMAVVTDKELKTGIAPVPQPEPMPEHRSDIAAMVNRAMAVADGNGVVTVSKTTTNVISISRSAINRIVTPFANPRLITIEPKQTLKWNREGSAIYISRQIGDPVGVFIDDEGGDQDAIGLTLIANDVPMREITLKPDSTFKSIRTRSAMSAGGTGESTRSEKGSSFTSGLMAILKDVALGNVPAGFNLTDQRMFPISCEVPGFEIRQGQYMRGPDSAIGVLVARNISSQALDFEESDCYRKGVVAVAAFPRVRMKPGEETELYIIARDMKSENPAVNRPILVR